MGKLTASFSLVAMLCLAALPVAAQPKVERSGNISKSATIAAIDHARRIVTLKDAEGMIEDVECGPEIKRFGELKVGDTVTFSYHAAVVLAVSKTATADKAAVGVVRGQGTSPSGAVTHQRSATVTIEAVDPATPSIK